MAIGVTDVEWGRGTGRGGSITVDSYGLYVATDCHGCGSVQLTDADDLIKLQRALSDLIQARMGRRGVQR